MKKNSLSLILHSMAYWSSKVTFFKCRVFLLFQLFIIKNNLHATAHASDLASSASSTLFCFKIKALTSHIYWQVFFFYMLVKREIWIMKVVFRMSCD